ncbi:lipid-A-disaccharide synthase N-terminal domain-containing protein [Autumnicola musiva]|uniref:Lipid-A-disaccharide synthase N-terminal domain-containing protein n=1 Tax=Autumnicola musiva TaxID=3075589 RepID=A0ABU3D1N3_9FLAO|nr:lipid-A-disaccharide synthase N-terminal domain-containing protein [Zunongwangia sp. F117]MDT0675436.1 lipid-A-disaccharide synthase N-terminal domain-containing protein [Zunongwangia sp. F117]
MNQWITFAIGFMAQLLFSARLVSQWFLSEKAKKVETPVMFWKLSLLASILLFTYGYLREDLAIMLGQFLIYGVYWRNLSIQNEWKNRRFIFKLLVVLFPILIISYIAIFGRLDWKDLVKGDNIAPWMIALGIFGQLVYTCRFFYQWYYAEKFHKSTLPKGFWILSLMGSSLLFTYGIFRKDPVLISAHFFGGIIYTRDLYLSKRTEAKASN